MGQACSSSPSLVVPACPKRGGTVVVLRFGGACESPLYGIRRCMTHTPGPVFHARCLHSWNSVRAKQIGIGNISPRASRRRIVRCWHPLGCRAIELGPTAPRGCDMHRRLRCSLLCWTRSPALSLVLVFPELGLGCILYSSLQGSTKDVSGYTAVQSTVCVNAR